MSLTWMESVMQHMEDSNATFEEALDILTEDIFTSATDRSLK